MRSRILVLTLARHARRVALGALVLVAAACARDPEAAKARHLIRAEAHTQQGRFAEAVIEYRNALEAQPQDGETRLKLAEAYQKANHLGQAIAEYIRAADQLPQRLDVQSTAGDLLLLAGRFDDARVRAEKALALSPDDVDARILLSNALSGLQLTDEALREIEEAIRIAPDHSGAHISLGGLEARRGRHDAAVRAFSRAVELDEHATGPHLALGNYYWSRRQLPEAERALKRASQIEPDSVLAHRTMTSFLSEVGRFAEAEPHLQRVVDITNTPDAVLALADFFVWRNDTASARSALQPLLASPSSEAAATVRLAVLDHADGQKEQAYARIEQVLAAAPTNLDALLSKAGMLLTDGRVDEALASSVLAAKSHPGDALAHLAIARAEQARSQSDRAIEAYQEVLRLNPRATSAHVALAQLQLNRGRSGQAVASAENALKTAPGDANARLTLVRGLIARGEFQRAGPELARLTREFPNSPAVRLQNGNLLRRTKDLTGARLEFEHAVRLAPDSTEALNGLVNLDLAESQPDVALARVKARLDRGDTTPAVLMIAARADVATGDLGTAEQLLRRILQQDHTYLPAYSALSHVHMRQGRVDAALTELDALAERDPRPATALTSAGIILQAQGRHAEAQQRFERALQLDPTTPVAANNLAWLYAESGGDLDIALQLAQTAYSKLADSAGVAHTLGYIYYKKDLLPQAVEMLKFAVEKEARNPTFHHHLGLALAKAGDANGARKHLSQALKLNPQFNGASEARTALDSLQ